MIDDAIVDQVLNTSSTEETPTQSPGIAMDDSIIDQVLKQPEDLAVKVPPSKWDSWVAGLDEGIDAINKVVIGMPLKGLSKLGVEAPYNWNKRKLAEREEARKPAIEENPKTAMAGSLTAGLVGTLPTMAIPGAQLGLAGKAGQIAKFGTQLFNQGATSGALLANSDDVGDVAKSAAITGVGSVALGSALTGIGAGVRWGSKKILDPQAAEIAAIAQEAGMPLAVTDIMKTGAGKKGLENTLDNVPIIGLSGFRDKQVDRYRPIVEAVIKKVGKESDGSLASVENAINANAKKMKDEATVLFDRVKELDNGMGRIDLSGVKNTAQSQIKAAQLGLGADSELTSIVNQLTSKGNKVNFAEARAIRSALSSKIRKLDKAAISGGADENVIRQLDTIKNSLDDAIDSFGMSGSDELVKAYAKAKGAYRVYSDVFKNNPEARRAMVDAAVMESWIKKAVTERNSVKAQRFQAALGNEGQTANRAFILREALEKATDKASNRFNPDVLVNEIQKSADNIGITFGDQARAVEGLDKLLRFTNRAFQSKQNPLTGAATIPVVGALGAFGTFAWFNPDAAGKIAIPIAALSMLMKRPQLFIKAAGLTEKTDPTVINYMTKAMIKTATNMGIAKGSQNSIQQEPQQPANQESSEY